MQIQFLFYLVFFSQILLLSFYFSRKLTARSRKMYESFSPADYPNLYPKGPGYFEKMWNDFRKQNYIILTVGMLILVSHAVFSYGHRFDALIAFGYFILQFIPFLIIEIKSLRYYKLRRATDERSSRKAELKPRRLFDFVSPASLGLAVSVYVVFVLFIIYFRKFDYPWFGGYLNIVGITSVNLFFAVILCWKLYGKKIDPYQDYEDRKREISLAGNQMIFISIAMTIFVTLEIIMASMDLREFKPVILSIYFQAIALMGLKTLGLESINFEVYRKESLNA